MIEPVRILSYNVRYFGHALRGLASTRMGKRAIARGIASLSPLPQIVCLQEVETSSLRSTLAFRPTKPEETQLESFMAELERAFEELDRPFPYEAFYFRAHANRDIVTADNAGASPLIANRTAIGGWETFDLIHNSDGSISLRAHANGDIVTAGNAGASPLIASQTAIGQREEFTLIRNNDGSISLRAHANNDIVTADNAGASPLIANRTAIGPGEEFDLIYD